MSEKNGRVCCNCRHCKRVKEDNRTVCRCDLDNSYLGYLTVMEHWCRHWSKEK